MGAADTAGGPQQMFVNITRKKRYGRDMLVRIAEGSWLVPMRPAISTAYATHLAAYNFDPK
jgi:hypothetical protein